MTDWQTGDVVTNGIRTHYLRSGGGKPPLVLLHGATDNGRCWTPVAEILAAEYDIVLPDARGHGQSDAPPSGYSSAERAADVAGLIQALGLDRVAVGGHSMGGQTAFRLAAEYPDLVNCAVLEDPGFRASDTPDPRMAGIREQLREEVALIKRSSYDDAVAYGRRTHPKWSDAEWPAWIESKQQVSDTFLNALRGGDEPPWTSLMPRIECPVLLVTGDPELGAIISAEVAEQARLLNPNVKVVHLAGAGHNIRRERFDGFVDAVRTFLAGAAVNGPTALGRATAP